MFEAQFLLRRHRHRAYGFVAKGFDLNTGWLSCQIVNASWFLHEPTCTARTPYNGAGGYRNQDRNPPLDPTASFYFLTSR